MKATFKTVVLKIMFYMATGLTAWFAGYGFGTFLKDLEKED